MTQEEAREYFDYNAETGELTWRVSLSSNAPIGAKAGCLNNRGYLTVQVNKKSYKVHRVIWLWVHGYFPEHQVDHINRDRADNRLENLREATQSCNLRNAKQKSNNISGVTGVSWYKWSRKWTAKISVNHRNHHLGYFQDFTDAVRARHQAEVEHNWPGCNNSTDAYQYLANL